MITEKLPVIGKIDATLTGPNGEIKDKRHVNNLVVQVGKNFLANAILNNSTSPFTHMAIGTNGTGPALSDTSLGTELVRQAFTTSVVNTNVVTMTATFAPGTGTGAIQEAGIFNNSVGGTMLSHVIFSVINKGSSDTLTITWTVTVG